jgi:hypothetical protein
MADVRIGKTIFDVFLNQQSEIRILQSSLVNHFHEVGIN